MSPSSFIQSRIESEPLYELGTLTPTFYWANIISVICYGILWRFGLPQPYENFGFRAAIVLVICAGLLTHKRADIPKPVRHLILYAILFSAPYFCLTMLMMNGFSNVVWTLTTSCIIYALFSCVRWSSGLVLVALALIAATGTATLFGGDTSSMWTRSALEFGAVNGFVFVTIYWSSNVRDQLTRLKAAGAGTAIAALAHEIRSPLYALRAGLFAVKAAMAPNDANIELIERLAHRIDNVSDTLNFHLRNLQLFNEPRGRLGLQPVDVADVLRDAVEIARQSADTPISVQAVSGHVMASRDALRQVLCNLIRNAENAVRAKRSGEISVGASRSAGMVRFSVEDTAATLNVSDIAAIFEPFHSLSGDSGLGIGLYVSKILCEGMGTSLCADVAHGKTIFWFALDASATFRENAI